MVKYVALVAEQKLKPRCFESTWCRLPFLWGKQQAIQAGTREKKQEPW